MKAKRIPHIMGQLVQNQRVLGALTDEEANWVSQHPDEFLEGAILQMRIPIKYTVDLSAPPRLPFDGAEVVKHEGTGKVSIELRSDDNLYIDGKKVELYLSKRQIGDKRIEGYELRKELEDGTQVLLNSNVLDYLYDHSELFPEHWKKNEQGETLYIFFWGSIFRDPSNGHLCVRDLCWSDVSLRRSYGWLGNGWCRFNPSVLLAS
jgi:hypothetical protein